jgi:hypothetical protein
MRLSVSFENHMDRLVKDVTVHGKVPRYRLEKEIGIAQEYHLDPRRVVNAYAKGKRLHIDYVLANMMQADPMKAWEWTQNDNPLVQVMAKGYWVSKYPELLETLVGPEADENDLKAAKGVCSKYGFGGFERAEFIYYINLVNFYLEMAKKIDNDCIEYLARAIKTAEDHGLSMERVNEVTKSASAAFIKNQIDEWKVYISK